MKLCTDCRWSRQGWFARICGLTVTMKCAHPVIGAEPVRIDPVNGKLEGGNLTYCFTLRMHSSANCGYHGKLWEPKS